MGTILIIDTSIFLNVLDVPGFDQDRDVVLGDMARWIDAGANMLLPMAAILETGNHLAQLSDGRLRRHYAGRFSDQVQQAIDGTAPWTPTRGIDIADVQTWLRSFPDSAMRRVGLADVSIIAEFYAACRRHAAYRVKIWSLDAHLAAHDRAASPAIAYPGRPGVRMR